MTSNSKNRPHEAGVEGLRGCAALCVLYTHFLWQTDIDPHYTLWPGWQILEVSQGAVLLFFILSGYVIGLTNHRPFTASNWGAYLWRRVVRLVPIYWLAIALSVLVRSGAGGRTIYGNALFLQNDISYGHWTWPLLKANTNLWTLNYEALYYLLFAVCWMRPRWWPAWAGLAFILSIILWWLPGSWAPLLTCYAMGWLFWLIGYGLSQLKSDLIANSVPLPWVSALCFWLVTWQEKPLLSLCLRFSLIPDSQGGWINFSYIDLLPASVVLLLAASGRRPRWTGCFSWLAAGIPLLFWAWSVVRGRVTVWPVNHFTCFCLAGCALWRWRPDGTRAWGRFAWIGSISYGLYVLQRPVQWFIHDSTWLPSGNLASFLLRLGLAVALTFVVAWLAEKKGQPWIRARLIARRNTVSKPVP